MTTVSASQELAALLMVLAFFHVTGALWRHWLGLYDTPQEER